MSALHSHFHIGLLESFQDFVEGALKIRWIRQIYCETVIAIWAGGRMAIPEEDVYELLAMVGTRFDVERFEIGRAKKLCINHQCANGKLITVIAKFVECDVLGNR